MRLNKYIPRRLQSRVLVIAVVVSAGLAWFYWPPAVDYPDIQVVNDIVVSRLEEIVSREGGSGCVMPALDPFSEEALRLGGPLDVGPLVCPGEDWVECHLSECRVKAHIARGMRDLVCEYRDILFVSDRRNRLGAARAVRGAGVLALRDSDHVQVSCSGNRVNESSPLGLFPSRWSGYKLGFRPVPRAPGAAPAPLNVMLLMFDSTSRNGFLRRMPKSYRQLEEMGAVVMDSHNIVLDGTPGALFPLLAGRSELELPDTRHTPDNDACVDETMLIFHIMQQHGYRTGYFEDWPWIATFTWRFNGFRRAPAHHYLRPLLAQEGWLRWWLVKAYNTRECIGDTPTVKLMMDATNQLHKLDGYKFSLTFFVGISHDNFSTITAVDDDLRGFLEAFQKGGRAHDTLLVLMGDHGQRYGPYRRTFQGKVEERLPFVAFVLPEKLKKARPDALKNLKANSKVLTTHYDMHTTLLDAVGLKEHRNTFKVPGANMERGLSMLEPIPKSRSCAEAGIMPHWCACARWREVPRAGALYRRVAEALADYINSLISEQSSLCVSRQLSSVEGVSQLSPDEAMLGYSYRQQADMYVGKYDRTKHVVAPIQLYQAKITIDPGHAVFEGTIYYYVNGDNFSISERDISRINAYGDEPKCVRHTHPHLNKYCYCKDQS